MENDKLFNLQLTVQKLEEELNLYRNGTTGSELLTMITEKDHEIDQLTRSVLDKNDKYKRLKVTSQEVLLRCDELQLENEQLKLKQEDLLITIAQKDQQVKDLHEGIKVSEYEKGSLLKDVSELHERIAMMEEHDYDNNDTIGKLQARMATLIKSTADKIKFVEVEKAQLGVLLKEEMQKTYEALERGKDFEDEISELSGRIHVFELDEAMIQKKLQASNKLSAELKYTNEESNATVAKVTTELLDANRKLAEEMRKKEDLLMKLATCEEQVERVKSKNEAQLQKAVTELDEQKYTSRVEKDALKKKVVDMKKKLDKLEGEYRVDAFREIERLKLVNMTLEARLKEHNLLATTTGNTTVRRVPMGDRTNAISTTIPSRPSTAQISSKYSYEAFSSVKREDK